MSETTIRYAGKFLKHLVGVLLLCWKRMLQTALFAGLIALIVAEIAAILVTGTYPTSLAHVAALIFGVGIAYGAALTVLFDEIIVGLIDTIRLVEGEAAAGARAASILVEHEASVFGLALPAGLRLPRRAPPAAELPASSLPASPPSPATADSSGSANSAPHDAGASAITGASETLAELAHEPVLPPLPQRAQGQPVRADQLPRISWAYHDPAQTLPETPAVGMAAPPLRSATTIPTVPIVTPPAASVNSAPNPVGTADLSLAAARDAATSSDRATRPLTWITRPLPPATGPRGTSSGIWERLSDALAGSPAPRTPSMPIAAEAAEPKAEPDASAK